MSRALDCRAIAGRLAALALLVLASLAPAAAQDAGGRWRLLTTREIPTSLTTVAIDIPASVGATKALRIENKGEAVEVIEVRVLYADVPTHRQVRTFRLESNERTRPIDPGASRFATRIEIDFKRQPVVPGQEAGRATLEIWGLQDAAGARMKRPVPAPAPVASAQPAEPPQPRAAEGTRGAPPVAAARPQPPPAAAPAAPAPAAPAPGSSGTRGSPAFGGLSSPPSAAAPPRAAAPALESVRPAEPMPSVAAPARESAAVPPQAAEARRLEQEMRQRQEQAMLRRREEMDRLQSQRQMPSPPPAAAAPAPARESAAVQPPPPAPAPAPTDAAVAGKPADWDLVPIYFGTDRAPAANPARIDYGPNRGRKLVLGEAVVSVPKVHQVPNVERPWVLQIGGLKIYEEKEDPKRHFTVQQLRSLSEEDFLAVVRQRLAAAKDFKDHALIFVHGFNNTFDGALYRTAQIAYDLKFDSAPFMYSWPSKGALGLTDYQYDRESATQAEPHFRQFMELVLKQSGAKTVSIIAHSMGNQLLLATLRSLKQQLPADVTLAQMVLAAPDVDRDAFEFLIKEIQGISKGITLLAASNDRALQVSKSLAGGEPRAGDVPAGGPIVIQGVDTIDVTAASTDIISLNHAGFAEKSELIEDIRRIIRTGERPPEKRFPILERVTTDKGDYWRFPAAKAVGGPALVAPAAAQPVPAAAPAGGAK